MRTVTATDLSRNFSAMLDAVQFRGEQLQVVRNNHVVAHIVPGPASMTAEQAFGDLYGALPQDAAADWLTDSRSGEMELINELRDPWAT